MARTEIEERAWSDTKMTRMIVVGDITRSQAMGILTVLWHDSQSEGKALVSEDDLCVWFAQDIGKGRDVISLLVSAGYLQKRADGMYKVDGNKHKLRKVETYKVRAKIAADSRWRSAKKAKKKAPCDDKKTDATSMLQFHASALPTARQLDNHNSAFRPSALGSADQYLEDFAFPGSCHKARVRDDHPPLVMNSLGASAVGNETIDVVAIMPPQIDEGTQTQRRTRTKKKNASESKCVALSGTNELIGHFVETYQKRYPQKPVIDGPAAGSAKRIVKALGLERAKQFVDAFMRMDDSWFLTKRHKLATLADNLDNVANFIATGVQVTATTIRSQELTNHNRSVVDQFLGRSKEA